MAKKDNQKMLASFEQRLAAHEVTRSRQAAKDWKEHGEKYADGLKGSIPPDTTLVDENGQEVLSITESAPRIAYDYAAYFAANPAHKADLEANYAKPASTTLTLTTKWVEKAPKPTTTPPPPAE